MDRKLPQEECLLCGAPLQYLESQKEMECQLCHRRFSSNACCQNGHFVCDSCHEKAALFVIREYCKKTESRDPVAIAQALFASPHIHMHGPEHHVLVGAALLAAYRNAGGDIDLEKTLEEMEARGSQVPGGICGLWGSCGAGISTGIFMSLITGSSPLSGKTWGLCNEMTSESLSSIAAAGGPRCCKRDSYTAILRAVAFVKERFGIAMEQPERVVCTLSSQNGQCLGKACPYHHSTE